MSESKHPKAIIFDLDDTILSIGAGTEELWHDLCYRYAPYLDNIDGGSLLNAINKFRNWYWSDPERHRKGRLDLINTRRIIISMAIKSLGIEDPGISGLIADSYTEERERLYTLFPGALDILKKFRSTGTKMALLTNGASKMQRDKIDRFNLSPFFDCITIEGEFGAGKPEKSVFLHTVKQLGVSPENTWMTGDDLLRDIEGGQKAGIYSIWIDWNKAGLGKDTHIYPDRIINSITELW